MMDRVGGRRGTVPPLPRRPCVRTEPGPLCVSFPQGRYWGTPLLSISKAASLRVCTPGNGDERDREEASGPARIPAARYSSLWRPASEPPSS